MGWGWGQGWGLQHGDVALELRQPPLLPLPRLLPRALAALEPPRRRRRRRRAARGTAAAAGEGSRGRMAGGGGGGVEAGGAQLQRGGALVLPSRHRGSGRHRRAVGARARAATHLCAQPCDLFEVPLLLARALGGELREAVCVARGRLRLGRVRVQPAIEARCAVGHRAASSSGGASGRAGCCSASMGDGALELRL